MYGGATLKHHHDYVHNVQPEVIHTLLFLLSRGELLGFFKYLRGWAIFEFLACLDMDFDMVLNKDATNFDY